MALLNKANLKTLVAIGTLNKKNKFICNATGFLVGFTAKNTKKPEEKSYYVFLVTNRHVFAGSESVALRFNNTKGKALTFRQELKFPNGELRWLAHKNKTVDLALLNVSPQVLKDNLIDYSIFVEEMFAPYKDFANIGIEVGDEVYVLGFPMGVAGEIQNLPYVKLGIISRVDNEIISKEKAYLIDSSIFPGNSGSPVVLKPTILSLDGAIPVSQIYLLGVISRYLPYQEQLYSLQSGSPIAVSLERENSGLSFVVPLDFVKQIFNSWIKQKKKLEKAQAKHEINLQDFGKAKDEVSVKKL